MLSKKAKYGLKALLLLAQHYEQGPLIIAEIAQQEAIPKKFLELILLELKKQGLLHSKKGKGGGYTLAKTPHMIKMGTIIRILDGPLAPLPCVSVTAYAKCQECKDEKTCGIRIVMKDVRDSIALILDSTSLADVLKRVNTITISP